MPACARAVHEIVAPKYCTGFLALPSIGRGLFDLLFLNGRSAVLSHIGRKPNVLMQKGFHMTSMKKSPQEARRDKARLQQAIDLYFAELGQGMNAYVMMREHGHEMQALNALSDTELFRRGLLRRAIPRHVFGRYFPS